MFLDLFLNPYAILLSLVINIIFLEVIRIFIDPKFQKEIDKIEEEMIIANTKTEIKKLKNNIENIDKKKKSIYSFIIILVGGCSAFINMKYGKMFTDNIFYDVLLLSLLTFFVYSIGIGTLIETIKKKFLNKI